MKKRFSSAWRKLSAVVALAGMLGVPNNVTAPTASNINRAAFDALLAATKASHSTALVIRHRGETIFEWYESGRSTRIEAMSATKSIVSMAIGRLVTTGKIESLDVPVHSFYPEWQMGDKAKITLRHLLNHTSGLQSNPTTEEIYQSSDAIKLALSANLSSQPGTAFNYNNKAVNLLAGIVKKVSGQQMDQYVKDEIFTPLGIVDFRWQRDDSGNPYGMAGLQLHARDLAKLGQLMANEGAWEGKQVLSKAWINESTAADSSLSPDCGLLWWLVPEREYYVVESTTVERVRQQGGDAELVAQIAQLVGRYESANAFIAARQRVAPDVSRMRQSLKQLHIDSIAKRDFGRFIGYRAEGYLGQYLYVFPDANLVAVRMVEGSDAYREETDRFYNFGSMVRALDAAGTGQY